MVALGTGTPQTKLSGICHKPIKRRLFHRSQVSKCDIVSAFHSSDREHHHSLSYNASSLYIPSKDRKFLGKSSYSSEACSSDENMVGASSTTAREKVGVLLLNLGGPETLQDVQPFPFNLFADPTAKEDNERFLLKLRNRMERLGLIIQRLSSDSSI
ncbi:uncharacterized protein A4U43_C06F6060 [Asparagus officinalis]|uniref:Ferrochelatase n=1 Tax=Asparagus officinalis TaxID=4686 RepID=A0A5P1ENA3_ASPOF|nr:ferrochelatase-1, chloroplastic/mitochondrial-like [Asparagus officinalis]ONK66279.1 uncharacterized protein A4U43_C06F6060 [Asparagus officinalis]